MSVISIGTPLMGCRTCVDWGNRQYNCVLRTLRKRIEMFVFITRHVAISVSRPWLPFLGRLLPLCAQRCPAARRRTACRRHLQPSPETELPSNCRAGRPRTTDVNRSAKNGPPEMSDSNSDFGGSSNIFLDCFWTDCSKCQAFFDLMGLWSTDD